MTHPSSPPPQRADAGEAAHRFVVFETLPYLADALAQVDRWVAKHAPRDEVPSPPPRDT